MILSKDPTIVSVSFVGSRDDVNMNIGNKSLIVGLEGLVNLVELEHRRVIQ